MKEAELKLVSELMKNSRRSDRELAKAVGVSQPTVSRIIKRLEEQGVIKEYTMIPDFRKLGYHLLVLTLGKYKTTISSEEKEKATQTFIQTSRRGYPEAVMIERGIGMGYDGTILSVHIDYSSYTRFRDSLRQFQSLETTDLQDFIINLDDIVRYRPLTLSTLAEHLPKTNENKE